ncbi:MAG: SpoIIE family protein phosphatase, partial [Planctomycetes bacterium]|nr:SpoIIE family protein phosphatase [Planctomycetota bacterium]
DTEPDVAEAIRKAIADQTECTVEILNYRKDGSPFWNRLSITPVRDGRGEVTNFIGVQSDITDRRNAEDGLRRANAKMKSNLAAASKVQQSMLPHVLPEARGFQFAWRYRPCEELAGDTLGCFHLDETHIGLYIVDVSGHGVAASLLSVTLSRTLLPIPGQSILYATSSTDPSERSIAAPILVAERLNRQFPFDERTSQFFTMVYGVLDTETALFEYVSAGHPPLVLLDGDGETRELCRKQLPIGILPEPGFVADRIQLQPGERLFFYTDGITEAGDGTDEQYEVERLRQTIATTQAQTLDAALDAIIVSVEDFCSGAEVRDDISLLAIEAVPV